MPMVPQRWKRLVTATGIALVVVLAPGAPGPGFAQAQPVRTGVTEKVKARLYVVRLQIGTTSSAKLGECRALEAEGLNVIIKPRQVPQYSVMPPRYKTIIEDFDTVDLDRRVQPKVHALVIDTSASMSGHLQYARKAAAEYVSQLDLAHEKVLIATFDESVSLWQGVTHDLDRLLAAIDRVRIGGQTAMLDGLVYPMREVDAPPERPVLVLLSD